MKQKLITIERLRSTLIKIQQSKEKIAAADGAVIQALASHGLKSILGDATPHESQTLALELNYLDVPISELDLNHLFKRWQSSLARFEQKAEKVHAIQRQYQISGLVETQALLGQRALKLFEADDWLILLDSDLDLLRQQKPDLVAAWLEYTAVENLGIYQRSQDQWKFIESPTSHLAACLPFYDWVMIWESVSYSSPTRLRTQGYDQVRRSPSEPDDQKHWEVHLVFGNGKSIDSPERSLWFCGCDQYPHL